jgi:AcrR family transcriptional regulator
MTAAPLRGPSETQRAKSAQTRARVLDAAVELIAREGPRGATSQQLVHASGVSWGAIQYQFGSKTGIFETLLDRTLLAFAAQESAGAEPGDLAERIHALVEAVVALLREPTYRAVRRMLQDPAQLEELGLQPADLMARIHAGVNPRIRALLGDDSLPADRLDLVQATLFASLSGIVEQARYDRFPGWMTDDQLRRLEGQLLEMVLEPS